MSGFYTDELATRLGLTRTSDYDELCRLPKIPATNLVIGWGFIWPSFDAWLDHQIGLAAEYAKCEVRDMATAARTLAAERLRRTP